MTTTEHADQPSEAPAVTSKPGLVFPKMWVLFGVLICCFTAWGVAADLTTPMVAGFKRIFDMNTFQASLVQLAYFGAYFLLAIPAALINQRFGYKAGLLTGVLLAAVGAIAFYPASKIMTYEAFLVALFAIAAGLLDPRDVRQPLRAVAGSRRDRDAATQLRPGLQPRRHQHRCAAGRDPDPAEVGRTGEHGRSDARPGAGDPRRRARCRDGPVPRSRIRVDRHRVGHRHQQIPADRRRVRVRRPRGEITTADSAVEQALRIRRHRTVFQRRGASLYVDLS